MELRQHKGWRSASRNSIIFIVACSISFRSASLPSSFGQTAETFSNSLKVALLALGTRILSQHFVHAFESYKPTTVLLAKRANEQAKHTSAFFNAIAVAIIAVLALSQVVSDAPPHSAEVALYVLTAISIHASGRDLLGQLKSERLSEA